MTFASAIIPTQFATLDGQSLRFPLVTNASDYEGYIRIFAEDTELFPYPRTNLCLNSSVIGGAAQGWLLMRASAKLNAIAAPNGLQEATLLTETTALGVSYVYRTNQVFIAGNTYTVSVYVKAYNANSLRMQFPEANGFAPNPPCIFDPVAGQITSGTGVMTDAGNGWWRCSITAPCIATTVGNWIHARLAVDTGLADSGVYLWGAQIEISPVVTGYIKSGATPVTVTDYSVDSAAIIALAVPGEIGTPLLWTGSYSYTIVEIPPRLAELTLISQYANSPTIRQLVQNMGEYFDPRANLDEFYNFVWNIDTAQGFGLDIWGRIVDVGRSLKIPNPAEYFGYKEASPGAYPFDERPFWDGNPPATQTYLLSDDAYRKLILSKALGNITQTSAPAINQLLQNFFADRGRAYANDLGDMSMRYVFEFALTDYEYAIVTQSGIILRPAGVSVSVIQSAMPVFGFSEAGGSASPFDQGIFIPEGSINAAI